MVLLSPKIKEIFRLLKAPPAFPERELTEAAERLHVVLLSVALGFALTLVIGLPFLFSNRPLGTAVCLLMLAACAAGWKLMHRGSVRQGALTVVLPLWIAVFFVTVASPNADVVPFVSVMFIAYLLFGPRLAVVVVASAVLAVTYVLMPGRFGIEPPRLLFNPSPQMVLYLTFLFVGLATAPFILLNRQLGKAIQHLGRFQSVHRELGVVTWYWDANRAETQWDSDLSPLLGLAPGGFSGQFRDYLCHLHPADAPIARDRLIGCIKSGRPEYRGEERVIWPDGSLHWMEVRGHLSYGARGRATRMTGTVTDITERKLAERALASAEERFKVAFEHGLHAICISKLSDGTIIDINPVFERLSGYAKSKTIGRTGDELGLWANGNARDHWFGELAARRTIDDLPMQFRNKDGSVLSTRLSSSVVDLGGEKCVITVARDVTAQESAERAIIESEQKYAAVFDTCPEAIALSRASDGTMLEVNEAWMQQTGYTRAQGVGHSALELGLWLQPSDRNAALAQLEAHGHVSNFQTTFRRADGTAIEVLLSGSKLLLNDEPCVAWSWRDIGEMRQLERARAASDRRYRTLFDSALDAIAIISPQGTLIDINQVGFQTTGYAPEELIGKDIEILFDPQRLARNPLRIADVYQSGSIRIGRRIRRKDGGEIPAEILAGPLPDGNILAIVRDVSERNRSQALLQHIARGVSGVVGETFFRSLVSNLAKELSADYCFIGEISPDDTCKVRTLAFCAHGAIAPNFEYQLEGSPCANVVSRHGTIAIPKSVAKQYPEDPGLQRMAVEGYIGTSLFDSADAAIGILVVMSRKTITEVGLWTSVLEIFAARAAAEMERTRAEARILEINASLERRVAERTAALESTNRELESFSYSVSHDLRAPLRAIEGFAAILQRECKEKLGVEDYSLLTRISQNAARMNQLIQDLLQFARAARGTLKTSRIDMRRLVDEVVAELQAGTDARAVISIGELPPATGDVTVLRLVWQNLIGNALKFSRNAAQPVVKIEGVGRDGMVEYAVSDNGAGFDAKYAHKLFGVFQRLHTSREFEGTGIGLAVSQRIVQRHGGSITAEGAVGAGATFRFTLSQ